MASHPDRERSPSGECPNPPRTEATPDVEIRDDGERTNVVVESNSSSLVVAWDSGETSAAELLDLLDDAEREIRHQVRATSPSDSSESGP